VKSFLELKEKIQKGKDDPCWKDYVQLGTKKKNGKEVPNCVPKESAIQEKAVSQSQQKMMGMALAYKRGEMDDASPEVKKMANSASTKDLQDFAKTKHKGLPVKKESVELEENQKLFMFKTKQEAEKKAKEVKGKVVSLTKQNFAVVAEEVELDETITPKHVKMAIGVASDKRYAGGNMTGAVNAIEKIKKGLSDHPQVKAVLRRQNESLDEAGYRVPSNYTTLMLKKRKQQQKAAAKEKWGKDDAEYLKKNTQKEEVEQVDEAGSPERPVIIKRATQQVKDKKAPFKAAVRSQRDRAVRAALRDIRTEGAQRGTAPLKKDLDEAGSPERLAIIKRATQRVKDKRDAARAADKKASFKAAARDMQTKGAQRGMAPLKRDLDEKSRSFPFQGSNDHAPKNIFQPPFGSRKNMGQVTFLDKSGKEYSPTSSKNKKKVKEESELDEAFKKGDSVTVKNARKYDALSKPEVSGTVIGMIGSKVMVKVGSGQSDRNNLEYSGQMNVDPKDLVKESAELDESKAVANVFLWNGKKIKRSFKNQSAAEAWVKKMKDGEDVRDYKMHAEEVELDEGKISRKFHKAMTWSKDYTGSPKDVEARVRKMSDKELLNLRGTDDDAKAGSGSARSAQIKMINREIRRRGIEEATDFRKGDTVFQVGSKLKGTVQHKGNRDLIAVKFGSVNQMIPASKLRLAEEVELDEAKGSGVKKFVRGMRVQNLNGSKGSVIKGGDNMKKAVEVEWDNGQTTLASAKYLKSIKKNESVEHENCGTPDCCGTCDTDIKEMNFFKFRNRLDSTRD
jgi:hypothetical protein